MFDSVHKEERGMSSVRDLRKKTSSYKADPCQNLKTDSQEQPGSMGAIITRCPSKTRGLSVLLLGWPAPSGHSELVIMMSLQFPV